MKTNVHFFIIYRCFRQTLWSKSNTYFKFNDRVCWKWFRLWGNAEEFGTAGHAADGNIVKGKVFPLQARCGPEGPEGRTVPPGKTRYPFYRRLGGPQGRSGRAENLFPTGIRSPDRPTRSSVAIPTELPAHLSIIQRMTFVCWIPKTTNTYSEYVIWLGFHGNNGYAEVS